jgi:hypothetical protein
MTTVDFYWFLVLFYISNNIKMHDGDQDGGKDGSQYLNIAKDVHLYRNYTDNLIVIVTFLLLYVICT